jgi:CubicO group peptidase (beta-lactamase class C family)
LHLHTLLSSVVCGCLLGAADASDGYYPPPQSSGAWRSYITLNTTPSPAEQLALQTERGVDWSILEQAWQELQVSAVAGDMELLVIKDGWIVGHWRASPVENLFRASIAKSFTSMAMMKLFDMSDAGELPGGLTPPTIGETSLARDYLPATWLQGDPRRDNLRLEHLMTMSSGLVLSDSPEASSQYLQDVLALGTAADPGTVWGYASAPVDLLSIIAQDWQGDLLRNFFLDEIGDEIEMQPFTWVAMGGPPDDFYTLGSAQLQITTLELARPAFLLLRDGVWDDGSGPEQVISTARVARLREPASFLAGTTVDPQSGFATAPESNLNYGHLSWNNADGKAWLAESLPEDAYYMAGFGTRYVLVVPSLDLVVVRYAERPQPWSHGVMLAETELLMNALGQSTEYPSFCDAADGSLASCPCGNAGYPVTGCDVQQLTGGVKLDVLAQETSPSNGVTLQGTGFSTMGAPATIVIRASSLEPGPVVFGDGLRCVGVPLVRLGAAFAAAGESIHTFGHGAMGGSGTRYYQLWFRNTPSMYCTPDAFNLSNGRTLTW